MGILNERNIVKPNLITFGINFIFFVLPEIYFQQIPNICNQFINRSKSLGTEMMNFVQNLKIYSFVLIFEQILTVITFFCSFKFILSFVIESIQTKNPSVLLSIEFNQCLSYAFSKVNIIFLSFMSNNPILYFDALVPYTFCLYVCQGKYYSASFVEKKNQVKTLSSKQIFIYIFRDVSLHYTTGFIFRLSPYKMKNL